MHSIKIVARSFLFFFSMIAKEQSLNLIKVISSRCMFNYILIKYTFICL